MPLSRLALPPVLRAALAAGLLAATALLTAAEGGFLQLLSPDLQKAAGLTRLSPPERTALDRLVAEESARAAAGQALPGTFVSRRTEAERRQCGLDRLSSAELDKLDELIAPALVARPKPKDRPRLRDDDVISAKPRAEVHGSVSFTLGWGSGGRNFRGTDLWLDYSVPDLGLSLGFGLSQYTGSPFYDYYPGGYDWPDLGRGPYGFDAYQRGLFRDDFVHGSGATLRADTPWSSFSYSRRHN